MRVKAGKARHRSKKRLFKEARGNFLGRRKLLRSMKETVLRAALSRGFTAASRSASIAPCGLHACRPRADRTA